MLQIIIVIPHTSAEIEYLQIEKKIKNHTISTLIEARGSPEHLDINYPFFFFICNPHPH